MKLKVFACLLICMMTAACSDMGQILIVRPKISEVVNNDESEPGGSDWLLASFRAYHRSLVPDPNCTYTQFEGASKRILFPDGTSFLDRGIGLWYNHYNANGRIYGIGDETAGKSCSLYNNRAVSRCYVYLKSGLKDIPFPLDVQIGQPLSAVLEKMDITEQYKAYANYYSYPEPFSIKQDDKSGEEVSLLFSSVHNELTDTSAETGEATFWYKRVRDIRCGMMNGLRTESVQLIFQKGILTFVRANTYDVFDVPASDDLSRRRTFYFPDMPEKYDERSGLHVRLKYAEVDDEKFVLCYEAYADNETKQRVLYSVMESADVHLGGGSEDITFSKRKKEYLMTFYYVDVKSKPVFRFETYIGDNHFAFTMRETSINFETRTSW